MRLNATHECTDRPPILAPVIAQKAFQDLFSRYGKSDWVSCSNDAIRAGVLAAAKGFDHKPGTARSSPGQVGYPDIFNAVQRGEVFSTNSQ